ncbi:MAG: 1,4-alpha-glucan branching protein domain-containing protein [Phycisphaeraceae bacterium]
MAYGSFVLVLHGHLPYVLRHGVWPHGEDWLYEAAAETYLPLLEMIGHCALHEASPQITIGLTPVLLEQLAHDHFKDGFEEYLADRVERAQQDRKEFEEQDNGHLAHMAQWWEKLYRHLGELFAKIDRDIPGAYAKHARDKHIQILTSSATHAYAPLLYEDASIRAQLRAGLASSHRILGFKPTGLWLPECAYRPGGAWQPPNHWSGKDGRIGVEHLIGDETLTHFFVENHLIEGSRSEWVRDDGDWHKVGWDESAKYPNRGWQSVNEPHLVNSDGSGPGRVTAMARDQNVCEAVWSGDIGYPADGSYLEFHKKYGPRRGLRYWKVTGHKVDLGQKDMYYPDDIPGKVHGHATHFCNFVKSRLRDYHDRTGRHGVVTATFDAELFGHWWFEGPQFLRDVILNFANDPDVDVQTAENFLHDHPPDKTVSMPEGSWGDGGDHRVWTNPQINWMWDIEYRCEANFGKATLDLPWRTDKHLEDLLKKAARELLLLQASDWPFVISRGQAVDYGIKRFMQHVSRFETLIDLAEKASQDAKYLNRLSEVEQFEVKDAELHDIIFKEIDLNWWNM